MYCVTSSATTSNNISSGASDFQRYFKLRDSFLGNEQKFNSIYDSLHVTPEVVSGNFAGSAGYRVLDSIKAARVIVKKLGYKYNEAYSIAQKFKGFMKYDFEKNFGSELYIPSLEKELEELFHKAKQSLKESTGKFENICDYCCEDCFEKHNSGTTFIEPGTEKERFLCPNCYRIHTNKKS